jgi:hypothetical protein
MISKRLRSALYVRNPALNSIGNRLNAVHKARQVGKRINLSAEKLDAFTLPFSPGQTQSAQKIPFSTFCA